MAKVERVLIVGGGTGGAFARDRSATARSVGRNRRARRRRARGPALVSISSDSRRAPWALSDSPTPPCARAASIARKRSSEPPRSAPGRARCRGVSGRIAGRASGCSGRSCTACSRRKRRARRLVSASRSERSGSSRNTSRCASLTAPTTRTTWSSVRMGSDHPFGDWSSGSRIRSSVVRWVGASSLVARRVSTGGRSF